MSNEEKETKMRELITDDRIIVKSITNINHKPHPYVLGAKHIVYTSDHHGGTMGDETLNAVPCDHPGCVIPYDKHTSDLVCFLQFKEDISPKVLQDELKKVVSSLGEDFVDGFAFVEGDGKITKN